MFPSWVTVLKLSKKVHFLQFYAGLSKKSKSIKANNHSKKPNCVKAIYIYASERSCYALSENFIVYYAMTYCFGDIRVWSRRILLNFCWVSIFFDILIPYISWTVAQTFITISFSKSVMRTFRCIYVNCFNTVRFFAEVSTKFQKMHFLDNLRTITQEGNMETRQMTAFFSSTFSTLTVCNIHFCIWK